jgi:hypothetical protein
VYEVACLDQMLLLMLLMVQSRAVRITLSWSASKRPLQALT